jgi:hypothetical protein
VAVDLDNLLDRGGLEEGRGDALLDAEDDTLGGSDADSGGAELDGLEGVFDLEEAAFGGEGVDAPVCKVRVRMSAVVVDLGGSAQRRISYCAQDEWLTVF